MDIYIYMLTFFMAQTLGFLLAFYLASILTYFLAYMLTFFLAFILESFLAFYLAFYLTFYSGILSGMYSDVPLTWALPDLNRERQISVVWLCPLRSGARGWCGSAHSQLTCGSAR